MAKGDLIGHIDCPVCGYKNGMRITEDKNGEPFGFCEADCDAQLRVGGKTRRVQKFFVTYSHLHKRTDTPPAQPAGGAVPVVPAKPVDTTETTPGKPVRRGFDLDDL